MKKLITSLVIAAAFIPSLSYAGPFGLNPGDAPSSLDVLKDLGSGVYELQSVPRPHPNFARYAVRTTPETGVCRIAAYSKTFENDASGRDIKQAYRELLAQLESVYGASSEIDRIESGAVWDDDNEWVMSIHQKERVRSNFWAPEQGFTGKDGVQFLSLRVLATSRTESSFTLSYDFENYDECDRIYKEKSAGAL